ncbi:MAG: SpoIID/LytB domain-containing protein [Clostridia bacterium]|nr:SpoIID/LytB domain-containing protein [Clostridia bacterium]
MKKFLNVTLILIIISILISGCSQSSLKQTYAEEPMIRVYNTVSQTTTELPLEEYVAGVIAGEVYNTWDIEALKTQCVLARTFALKYIEDNPEIYKEKGISTNIADAQSYDESTINSSITEACKQTRGEVLTYNNELINAYFHSNSGGKTVLASDGFNGAENLPYIKSVSSPENSENSKNYNWSASFTKAEVLNALNKMGITLSNISSASLGEKTDSQNYKTIIIGGREVNLITLRNYLGSTRLKSTKLTSAKIENDYLKISGVGYGHGVGVSQWGAKILADQGKNYQQIIDYYFSNVKFETIY